MNGAESLLRTLVAHGVDTCFTNPGTSEIQFVSAADRVHGMRCVLSLFEGVCSGAADGYGRMLDKPAATLLHLGPGFGNGIANFHNAMRAKVPIVNIIGEHATYHKVLDAPLTSDIHGYAGLVSGWTGEVETAPGVPTMTCEAITASMTPPGKIATLIVPADCSWDDSIAPDDTPLPAPAPTVVSDEAITAATKALQTGETTAFLMNGRVLRAEGTALASQIASHTKARFFYDTFATRLERGAGRVELEKLPYFPELVTEAMKGVKHLILVGTKTPVAFFAYPNIPGQLLPEDCQVHQLATDTEDGVDALQRLRDALGAGHHSPVLQELNTPKLPVGELNAETIATAVAALMPENAIVCEEAITSGGPLINATACSQPHDWLHVTGGAIGGGMPLATGAAVACPDRRVLSLQADGSAMYTSQSLWTQARESLDVTTVIYANREYKILSVEHDRVGAGEIGEKALEMLTIDKPELNFAHVAQSMGVTAKRVTTLEEFNSTLAAYLAEPGPNLIEAVI